MDFSFFITDNKSGHKTRETWFQKKWGVDFFPQHKDFINKQKKTKKERYGDENYNNVEKMKSTKEELYGDSGYDNGKSESQIMKERGIPRIWDCGNKKWVINL